MDTSEIPENIQTVDALGLLCPEPIMLLHAAMRRAAPGDQVRLLSTDPSSERDVVKFCQFLGHELLEHSDMEGQYTFLIQKSG
jgi:tRNA 2-thiouridine synthesizing protein A